MSKKIYMQDGTRIIDGANGENPKLKARLMDDGRESLYLEYYAGYEWVTGKSGKPHPKARREFERLGLFLLPERKWREHNREVLELAKKIRFEREQERKAQTDGFRIASHVKNKIDLIEWMWQYIADYTKRDARVVKSAVCAFVDFLTDPRRELQPAAGWTAKQKKEARAEREARARRQRFPPQRLTPARARAFVDYLQARFTGEGALSVYKRFKKMIGAAVDAGHLQKSPFEGLTVKADTGTIKKNILSVEEIKAMAATHYPKENPAVRRAFLFSCYAGVRWCDVVALTYGNVDFANGLLRFNQNKTIGHSSASGVTLPLSPALLKLIDIPSSSKPDKEPIFPLPSYNAALKALQTWTKKAGINKHISWHCARHSFAVNVLNNGANIKTVSELLGHSSLRCTEVYTRAVDSLKAAAMNSLPDLDL